MLIGMQFDSFPSLPPSAVHTADEVPATLQNSTHTYVVRTLCIMSQHAMCLQFTVHAIFHEQRNAFVREMP